MVYWRCMGLIGVIYSKEVGKMVWWMLFIIEVMENFVEVGSVVNWNMEEYLDGVLLKFVRVNGEYELRYEIKWREDMELFEVKFGYLGGKKFIKGENLGSRLWRGF